MHRNAVFASTIGTEGERVGSVTRWTGDEFPVGFEEVIGELSCGVVESPFASIVPVLET